MIKILDCTLRDGGYINNWIFGHDNIKYIEEHLKNSGVDIIEYGYVSGRNAGVDSTIYKIEEIVSRKEINFVCMVDYGEHNIEEFPYVSDNVGIRVAFHKCDVNESIEYCVKLIERGYRVYVQPMYTMGYSCEEFTGIIKKINEINPFAVYIVDSFGDMVTQKLKQYYEIAERELNIDIEIGLHGHNNMNLSQSNAIFMCEQDSRHNIIIDSSVKGMGRGAGNLETEFMCLYLNENYGTAYNLVDINNIKGIIMKEFFLKNPWGFSEEYYYSALYHCHPFYAKFFEKKNGVDINDVKNLLSMIKKEKKEVFDYNYIEEMYNMYANCK